jgi:hypothetical protein
MITRYNYEEYFLLYVDNELSASEKIAVEEFIQQNPDLGEELTMLKQSVLKPQYNIVFEKKETLIKHANDGLFINFNNYEECFLLYTDNELDNAGKRQVEEFIAKNPSLQDEFNLFQQTKLTHDNSIIFEGKEALYKKEEKKKPILFAWMASAAAVAILLVTGFLFFNTNNNGENTPSVVIAQKNDSINGNGIKHSKKETLTVTSSNDDSLNRQEKEIQSVAIEGTTSEKKVKSPGTKMKKEIQKNKMMNDDPGTNPVVDVIKNENELAIAKIARPQIIDEPVPVSNADVAPDKIIVMVDKTTDQNIKSSYTGLPATADNSYPSDDYDSKNKLRGIFRRVSRVFNKATNDDDTGKHSVAIGSFQIALK